MKSIISGEWRRWAVVLLGAGLLVSPWIFRFSGPESSINSWIVGSCLILVAWHVPVVFGSMATGLAGSALGIWLLSSPFALGFVHSTAAWIAWFGGALTVALAATPEATFDLAARIQEWRLRRGIHRVSPHQIACYEEPNLITSPDTLCQQIVERSYQIRRSLSHKPTEIELEMCVLGYRTCVRDGIKLSRIIDAERLVTGMTRRWRLELAQRQSAHALSRAREQLPPQALRIQRQSEV